MSHQHFPCAYHQNQHITNFCDAPHCSLPLCPECIRIHIQEHTDEGTQPSIDTITNVVNNASKAVAGLLDAIKEGHKRAEAAKDVGRAQINLILQESKKAAIDIIETHFFHLQQTMDAELSRRECEQEEQIMQKTRELTFHENSLNGIAEGLRGSQTFVANLVSYYQKYGNMSTISGLRFLLEDTGLIKNSQIKLTSDPHCLSEIKRILDNYMLLHNWKETGRTHIQLPEPGLEHQPRISQGVRASNVQASPDNHYQMNVLVDNSQRIPVRNVHVKRNDSHHHDYQMERLKENQLEQGLHIAKYIKGKAPGSYETRN